MAEGRIPMPSNVPEGDCIARALRAMEQLSSEAEKNGTSDMTLDEINAEIDAARRDRIEKKDYLA